MILNLTQHLPTSEQASAGVGQPIPQVVALLNFVTMPSWHEIDDRARRIVEIASQHEAAQAMIGGAPYLMPRLEKRLLNASIEPLYAFSERVSEEEVSPDGSVRKVTVFRHAGFISDPSYIPF
jgi:hypothetical protein